MRIYSRENVIHALPYDRLVNELPRRLLQDAEAPQRHVHTVSQPGEPDASLLLMPAWSASGAGGVKIVNVTPGNAGRSLPAVTASYLLFDAVTGEHKALLDGGELTARRTAAVAAVAAQRLARADAHRLLLIGSGRIATELAFAYRAVRDIRHISVHSPTHKNAERLAHHLRDNGFDAHVCDDLQGSVHDADIIACATLSHEPIVKGSWLKPGQHVALIGGYLPDMREADDEVIARGTVWVDTLAALKEAGDVIALSGNDIKGTLFDLCGVDAVTGREEMITIFKSVGDASQDLAAAAIAVESA
ncbi:MAG: ornithine cyclodeaminase family protein [Asticcacaulis sp.]|nr:ornithine cyclodeaminase family protein [Asticcacaulis sp.]